MKWVTKSGDAIRIKDMSIEHVKNIIKFIYRENLHAVWGVDDGVMLDLIANLDVWTEKQIKRELKLLLKERDESEQVVFENYFNIY